MSSEPASDRDWRGNVWITGVLPIVIWLVVLWLVGTSRVANLKVFVVLFIGFVAGMFLVPFSYHLMRAARARNPWLPFEQQPWGRYTFMANHRWQSLFRAPPEERRTTGGLVVRYATWGGVMASATYALAGALRL
ncbi:hypothetical protein ACOCJ7_11005 [Knoellia sp. CPCC 206453]|uniref:hypothetical protein n=1 Tax=Knoellia pratensis TaxID=3404796 RepID=UPI00360940B2